MTTQNDTLASIDLDQLAAVSGGFFSGGCLPAPPLVVEPAIKVPQPTFGGGVGTFRGPTEARRS